MLGRGNIIEIKDILEGFSYARGIYALHVVTVVPENERMKGTIISSKQRSHKYRSKTYSPALIYFMRAEKVDKW